MNDTIIEKYIVPLIEKIRELSKDHSDHYYKYAMEDGEYVAPDFIREEYEQEIMEGVLNGEERDKRI